MQYTQIRGGYAVVDDSLAFEARNRSGSVGTVEVGTGLTEAAPWVGNDVSAGVTGFQGAPKINAGNFAVGARIASIIIHGALGSTGSTHGIDAPEVVSVRAGVDFFVNLTPGPENDSLFTPFPAALDPTRSTYLFEIVGSGSA